MVFYVGGNTGGTHIVDWVLFILGESGVLPQLDIAPVYESEGLDGLHTILASLDEYLRPALGCFADNDGMVPTASAEMAHEYYPDKQVRDFSVRNPEYAPIGGYDHREMVEGKLVGSDSVPWSNPSEDPLFVSIIRDLIESVGPARSEPLPSDMSDVGGSRILFLTDRDSGTRTYATDPASNRTLPTGLHTSARIRQSEYWGPWLSDAMLSWSPDAAYLAFHADTANGASIVLMDLNDGGLRVLTDRTRDPRGDVVWLGRLAWSSDARHTAVQHLYRSLSSTENPHSFSMFNDVDTREPGTRIIRSDTGDHVARVPFYAGPDAPMAMDWERHGDRIAFISYSDAEFWDQWEQWPPGPRLSLYTWDFAGSAGMSQLDMLLTECGDAVHAGSVRWSPDGAQIAFSASLLGLDSEIYLLDLSSGQGAQNLTRHAADDAYPSWSPDGSKIAFHTNRDGNYEVYVMDVASGQLHNITSSPANDMAPSWSPALADADHVDALLAAEPAPPVSELGTTSSVMIRLHTGLNVIHVPVQQEGVDKVSSLYRHLGGSDDVASIVSLDPDGQFVAFTSRSRPGASGDTPINDSTAVVVIMKRPKDVGFSGAILEPVITFRQGINLIGFPRHRPEGRISTITRWYMHSSEGETPPIRRVIREENGRFISSPPSDNIAEPGRGYIVLATEAGTLPYTGDPWRTTPSVPAAPAHRVYAGTSAALVIEGSVGDSDGAAPTIYEGMDVCARTRLSPRQHVARIDESGRFALPIVLTEGKEFTEGNVLTVSLEPAGQSITVHLRDEHLRTFHVDLGPIGVATVPAQTSLQPNYPNPFNPETWIPFELSEDAKVTVTVYDVLGRVVRRLDLGQQASGVYRTPNRAAHWDGRNDRGEEVASGAYFVELTAGEFREMRRLVLMK